MDLEPDHNKERKQEKNRWRTRGFPFLNSFTHMLPALSCKRLAVKDGVGGGGDDDDPLQLPNLTPLQCLELHRLLFPCPATVMDSVASHQWRKARRGRAWLGMLGFVVPNLIFPSPGETPMSEPMEWDSTRTPLG